MSGAVASVFGLCALSFAAGCVLTAVMLRREQPPGPESEPVVDPPEPGVRLQWPPEEYTTRPIHRNPVIGIPAALPAREPGRPTLALVPDPDPEEPVQLDEVRRMRVVRGLPECADEAAGGVGPAEPLAGGGEPVVLQVAAQSEPGLVAVPTRSKPVLKQVPAQSEPAVVEVSAQPTAYPADLSAQGERVSAEVSVEVSAQCESSSPDVTTPGEPVSAGAPVQPEPASAEVPPQPESAVSAPVTDLPACTDRSSAPAQLPDPTEFRQRYLRTFEKTHRSSH